MIKDINNFFFNYNISLYLNQWVDFNKYKICKISSKNINIFYFFKFRLSLKLNLINCWKIELNYVEKLKEFITWSIKKLKFIKNNKNCFLQLFYLNL